MARRSTAKADSVASARELDTYAAKRDFARTAEPGPEPVQTTGELRFVVQRHAARRLHYDLRLELDGVLLSWAVPKGPSRNPKDKRLAVRTEDHPYAYRTFAGTIPAGQYGGGEVWIWDEGTYTALGAEDRAASECRLRDGLAKGELKIVLHGEQLQGEWVLVRVTSGRYASETAENWLLIKHRDAHSTDDAYDANQIEPLDRPRGTWQSREEEKGQEKDKDQGKDKEKEKDKDKEKLRGGKRGKPSAAEPMPQEVVPMLAQLHEEVPAGETWWFEIKWDGYRAVAEVNGPDTRLYSRNLKPLDTQFQTLTDELRRLPGPAVLDGEVVVVDAAGRSVFQRLQHYDPHRDGPDLRYYAFDALYLDGQDLRDLPLHERKARLSTYLAACGSQQHLRLSDHVVGNGQAFFALAEQQGLEGILAKDANSPYRTGQRSHEWRKVKVARRQPAVICGYTDPQGGRKWFGSLILGVYEPDGTLRHVGDAGTGFSDKRLRSLYDQLQPLRQDVSPFDGSPQRKLARTRWGGGGMANWVRPELVCEVAYAEWTNEGRLRHPSFQGLLPAVDPQTVRQLQGTEAPVVPHPPADMPAARTPKSAAANRKAKATADRLASHPFRGVDQTVTLDGRRLPLTNLDKPFFPPHPNCPEGHTKGDVIAYYQAVSPWLLPHLQDRPESLRRCPNGIEGECFYQKDMDTAHPPEWARTAHIAEDSPNYLVCDNAATLAWMNQQGCIDVHPFTARLPHTDHPDYIVLDLDPDGNPMTQIAKTARVLRTLLEEAGVDCFLKTSGSTGLHICVPLGARHDFETARQFAELIARLTHQQLPDFTSIERPVKNRKGKIYVDYLQNRAGQTIAAPYSLRPKPGAPVSMPLDWEELHDELQITDYHLGNAIPRLQARGDLFAPLLTHPGADLERALQRMGGNG